MMVEESDDHSYSPVDVNSGGTGYVDDTHSIACSLGDSCMIIIIIMFVY